MSFSSDIQKFAKKTNQRIDKVMAACALSVFSSIILRTPVDTGRARANWLYTTKEPSSGTRDSTKRKSINPKAGKRHILFNNLPYIERLENGSSTQAPSGMVKVTVTEFETHLKNAVKKL